ncbi:MAG: hypothetical protein ABI360_06920, partial [Allobranchiibius sp.]
GGGDEFVRAVAAAVMHEPLSDPDEIVYRQEVLVDALRDADAIRRLHQLAGDAVAAENDVYRSPFRDTGEQMLRRSVKVLALFVEILRSLRELAQEKLGPATSPGLIRFYEQVRTELGETYLEEIEQHVKTLGFTHGLVLSASLGPGNAGTDYVLRAPLDRNRGGWWHHGQLKQPTYGFTIAERDQAGFEAAAKMRDRGVSLVARALSEAVDHMLDFFVALRAETAFYLGAVNLQAKLTALGHEVCRPSVQAPGRALYAAGLYEPCLALRSGHQVIGNDLRSDGIDLIVVTGANQGGKSTFLRSMGLAFVMAQSGMFVAASQFSCSITTGLFTHFMREEDRTMVAGKFDEELDRMSTIVDHIQPGGLLLCNESFAATNEREGSQIAAELVAALREQGVRVVFVTHMFDLAHRYVGDDAALCLRADRSDDGNRSLRLQVAPPTPTAFGADLYRRTFDTANNPPLSPTTSDGTAEQPAVGSTR